MLSRRRFLQHSLVLATFGAQPRLYADGPTAPKPALMLANPYREDIDLRQYWVSEKLDGVRAYWNGRALISRGGHPYAAPPWFTAGFPATPLDGELWSGRGQFDSLSGAVRRDSPDPEQWRRIRYRVFDLPAAEGRFEQRLGALRTLLRGLESPYIALLEQDKIADKAALMQRLERIVAEGGEGLMLHLGSAPYRGVRSDDLLKLKRYDDAEARVIAHLPGSGKYRGALGALLVEMPSGLRFKIGSGFSDAQRRDPPPLGSTISYRYTGLSERGVPRFASFLRLRRED